MVGTGFFISSLHNAFEILKMREQVNFKDREHL